MSETVARETAAHRIHPVTAAPSERQAEAIAQEEEHAAHNYHPQPVVVAEGEGAWDTDIDGRRYLACLAAYSAVNFGHSNPELLDEFDEEIDGDGEELGYAADEAYEQLTGTIAPDLGIPAAASEPEGTPLDFENERVLAERYPKLWERFRE